MARTPSWIFLVRQFSWALRLYPRFVNRLFMNVRYFCLERRRPETVVTESKYIFHRDLRRGALPPEEDLPKWDAYFMERCRTCSQIFSLVDGNLNGIIDTLMAQLHRLSRYQKELLKISLEIGSTTSFTFIASLILPVLLAITKPFSSKWMRNFVK